MKHTCPNCSYTFETPTKKKISAWPDPIPDPEREGYYINTNSTGTTHTTSFFISGKERQKDANRRAKMSEYFGTTLRNASLPCGFRIHSGNTGVEGNRFSRQTYAMKGEIFYDKNS